MFLGLFNTPRHNWRFSLAKGGLCFALALSVGGCDRAEEDEDEESSEQSDKEEDQEDSADNSEVSGDSADKDPSDKKDESKDTSDSGKDGSNQDSESSGTSGGGGDDTSSGDTGKDGTGTQDPDAGGDETPSDYCKDVSTWDPAWTKLEDEILKLVNEFRAKGADCKSAGKFKPAGPVTLDKKLRCAARVHSKDMGERNFFDHTNPDKESPFDRIKKSGFIGMTAGENIAAGNAAAQATMDQWIGSDGHCSNMMNPRFTKLGVGYYPKPSSIYRHYWTQNFGG